VKKILCVGYRDWALNIYKKISQNYNDGEVVTISSRDKYSDSFVREYSPDIILFYGWSWIISENIVDKYKCIMLHPSKLPKYRGGSPIQNQIIRGENNSAVTLFLMDKRMDAGRIIFQEPMSLSGSISNIFNRIEELGYKGTMQFLNNPTKGVNQSEEDATYFKRLTEKQGEITLDELTSKSANYLYNKVRMLQEPYPLPYFVTSDNKKLFIHMVSIKDN